MDQPLQFGPAGVMLGEYHLSKPSRQALLEAVGKPLRPESSTDRLIEEVEHAIAAYHAWSRKPNDAYFPQPSEPTEKDLAPVRDASAALAAGVEKLSDETRLRLGESGNHQLPWQAIGLRNRCDAALASAAEQLGRKVA